MFFYFQRFLTTVKDITGDCTKLTPTRHCKFQLAFKPAFSNTRATYGPQVLTNGRKWMQAAKPQLISRGLGQKWLHWSRKGVGAGQGANHLAASVWKGETTVLDVNMLGVAMYQPIVFLPLSTLNMTQKNMTQKRVCLNCSQRKNLRGEWTQLCWRY